MKQVLSRKKNVRKEESLLGYDVVESYEVVERDTKTGELFHSEKVFKRTPVRTKTNLLWG